MSSIVGIGCTIALADALSMSKHQMADSQAADSEEAEESPPNGMDNSGAVHIASPAIQDQNITEDMPDGL